MRWLALSVILCGCSLGPKQDLDISFEQARDSLRAGDLDKALTQADEGLRLALSRNDLTRQWQFRLLRCDILAYNHRPEEMLAALADSIPSSPAFASLAARKLMLEGQAQGLLNNTEKSAALYAEAHRAAEGMNAQELLAEIESLEGPAIHKLYGPARGEALLFHALQRASATNSQFVKASILLNLGAIRLRNMRWEEAASFLEQTLTVADPRWKVLYAVAQN